MCHAFRVDDVGISPGGIAAAATAGQFHRMNLEQTIEAAAADDDGDAARREESLRGRHRLVLGLAGLIVLGSLLLEVVPGGRVAVRGLPQFPLPQTCAARTLLDRGCPGCGLTRSFIHLANGRWQASLEVHRLGWLFALAMLLQLPYRAAGLACRNPLPLGRQIPQVFGGVLLALLLANWLYGLLV
jgi:hypothetical protein